MTRTSTMALPLILLSLLIAACVPVVDEPVYPACDPDNGGLELPAGFCALIVADSLGRARHLVVDDEGDIYIALRQRTDEGGLVALRDNDGDGRIDEGEYFGDMAGTGIGLRNGFLYFGADTLVRRYPLTAGELAPSAPPEAVVTSFPAQRGHSTKPFAFDQAGNLYVNVGAPSNACQESSRSPGSPGLDPCPLLEQHAGIWRFEADLLGQTFDDGTRYATGIRNAVAIDWNPVTDHLYVAQHGRDQLGSLWPEIYNDTLNAELPSEELFEVDEGDDFGWPYCFYDHLKGKKVLAPEYGGDGETVGRCAEAEDPIVAFPGHWAPNDLLFYNDTHFPERYRGGAFIAFHGSWNRSPLEQEGFRVAFAPFEDGKATGTYETFANGFAGAEPVMARSEAKYRPMGLAVGPDGSLYVVDSNVGRVWRIVYSGE